MELMSRDPHAPKEIHALARGEAGFPGENQDPGVSVLRSVRGARKPEPKRIVFEFPRRVGSTKFFR